MEMARALNLVLVCTTVCSVLASGFSESICGPGDHDLHTSDGRKYRLHVPPNYSESVSVPLVVGMHGLGDSYTGFGGYETHMTDLSDEQGFVAVFPQGSKSWSVELTGYTWNGGGCCMSKADDISFIRNVIANVTSLVNVDEGRVYAYGFSAGGVMAHRVACELSDVVAGVVSVSGPIMYKECNPSHPVSVMHVHGTLDPIFPYRGGGVTQSPGAKEVMDIWAKLNKCEGEPKKVYEKGTAKTTSYPGSCALNTTVSLTTMKFGFHSWPTRSFDTTAEIWNFFQGEPAFVDTPPIAVEE